ncbi:MAG: efflux RND transporter periplasmic adaptor subunit [Cyclonatronaceae bacterium]
MKTLLTALFVSIVLIITGCGGGGDHGHSHGEDGDHTHEQPAQQTPADLGQPVPQTQNDHDHPHDGDDAHTHETVQPETHSHGDEEHRHEAGQNDTHSHDGTGDHSHEAVQMDTHSHGDTEHRHEETESPSGTGDVNQGHSHDGDPAHQHTDGGSQLEGVGVITQWTDKTELFMEYPELVAGREATFAVHLTRLSDFAPLENSTVTFFLRSESGATVSVTETDVRIPGIYGPDITFEQAGRYDLVITIQGMVDDVIHVHGIPVYASDAEVPHTHDEEDPNLVSFLKEQQWNIPFGTQKVGRRTLSESIVAHGELVPVQSRDVVVTAPFSGIIPGSAGQNLPVEGQTVQKGAPLLQLNPSVQSADGENYVQQFIDAQSQLTLAQKNLERSERLYEREAIPELELEKARMEYRRAHTRFRTINEIVQIDTASAEAYGDPGSSYRFDIKAPIAGSVVESHVRPGMQVQAGDPLVRIADMSKMWLSVHLPAAKRDVVRNAGAAVFYVQGDRRMYTLDEVNGLLISSARHVDPQTRTLSLIYEIDNREGLHSGLFVTAEIDTEQKEQVIAVPRSALIEEEGFFSVYVQVGGESFEKRRITTGIRNRDMVEVLSGLNEGERLVTINPYQVKLASLSSEAPAHGHAH